eukprot:GFYU01002168.1.p1 GENE.GFYU01002168.1~~GFYU01002168.1.p1  ORF type:complete len:686 (+),score=163.94 GFYU01002168.1:64-2121(+)
MDENERSGGDDAPSADNTKGRDRDAATVPDVKVECVDEGENTADVPPSATAGDGVLCCEESLSANESEDGPDPTSEADDAKVTSTSLNQDVTEDAKTADTETGNQATGDTAGDRSTLIKDVGGKGTIPLPIVFGRRERVKPQRVIDVENKLKGDTLKPLYRYFTSEASHSDLQAQMKTLKHGLTTVGKRMPKNAECHFHMGLIHFRQGALNSNQQQKASQEFRKVLECLPKVKGQGGIQGLKDKQIRAKLNTHLSQCATSNGLKSVFDSAEERLIQAAKLDNQQPDIWNNLGLLYYSSSNYTSAITIFEKVLSVFPDYVDALCNLGLSLWALDKLEEATACFQEAIRRDGSHVESLVNYGCLLLCQKESDLAVAVLEKALELGYTEPYVWNNLGCAYNAAQRLDDAGEAFRQASILDPQNIQIKTNLACYLMRAGAMSPAEQVVNSMFETHQPSQQSWLVYGMLFAKQQEFAETEEMSEQLADQAAQAFSRALELNPENAQVWIQLGLLSVAQGDYLQSQEFFKNAIQRDRTCVGAWNNLGVSMHLSDQVYDAQKIYEKVAHSEEVVCYQVYNNLGNLYRQQGFFKKSEKMYLKCLSLKGDFAPAFNNLGLLYIAVDRFDAAEEMLKTALQVQPDFVCAQSNLVKLRSLMQRKGKKPQSSKAGGSGSKHTTHTARTSVDSPVTVR